MREVAGEVGRGGRGGGGKELQRECAYVVGGGGGGGRGEVLVELVGGEGEEGERGGLERERGGEVGEALVWEVRRGEELDGGEGERVGGNRGEVEGGEVGELLERDGLGCRVRGADLSVDRGERPADGQGLAGGGLVGAEGLDEIVQGELEEGVCQRRGGGRCRLGGSHRIGGGRGRGGWICEVVFAGLMLIGFGGVPTRPRRRARAVVPQWGTGVGHLDLVWIFFFSTDFSLDFGACKYLLAQK